MTKRSLPAPRALGRGSFLERVLEAAERHGADGDPDMEVGDLQQLATDLWNALTFAQKSAFAERLEWRAFLDDWPTFRLIAERSFLDSQAKRVAERTSPSPSKTKRPRCPKCKGPTHRCKTGDKGCRHCNNNACGHTWMEKS